LDVARTWFVRRFREGRFGEWTLDELAGRQEVEVQTAVKGEGSGSRLVYSHPSTEVDGFNPQTLSPTDFDSQVSTTVANFLSEQRRALALRAEGVPSSVTQEKKQAKARQAAERAEKARIRFEARSGGTPLRGKSATMKGRGTKGRGKGR
jgi:hypothetical protein